MYTEVHGWGPADRWAARKNTSLYTFSEHERSTEMKYRDISIMFGLPPVLGVLRLAADRVADLSVLLGPVVVPGPHGDVLDGGI